MRFLFTQPYDEEDFVKEAGNGEAETMATGRMSGRVYGSYFRAGGGVFLLTLLVLNMILAQISTSGADYWLSYWTNVEAVRASLHNPETKISSKQYQSVVNDTIFSYFDLLDDDGLLPTHWAIYIYTFCILACIVLTLTRSFLFMKICMDAGRSLHNTMFANILQATMRFFNANPSGKSRIRKYKYSKKFLAMSFFYSES